MSIYILFYGCYWYPRGGWKDLPPNWDFLGSQNLMKKRAKKAFEKDKNLNWYHIVQLDVIRFKAKIVEEGGREDLGL